VAAIAIVTISASALHTQQTDCVAVALGGVFLCKGIRPRRQEGDKRPLDFSGFVIASGYPKTVSTKTLPIASFLCAIDAADWTLSSSIAPEARLRLGDQIERAVSAFQNTFLPAIGSGSRPRFLRTIAGRCAEDLRSFKDLARTGDHAALEQLRDDWIRYLLPITLGDWRDAHRPATEFQDLKKARLDWNQSVGPPA